MKNYLLLVLGLFFLQLQSQNPTILLNSKNKALIEKHEENSPQKKVQQLRPVAQKVSEYHRKSKIIKFDLFEINTTSSREAEYKKAATDITVMKANANELKRLVDLKPEFIEISFPFQKNKEVMVELYRNEIFTNDFKVTTGKGEVVNYTPGVYYQGIVKGNNNSIVAFSFFEDDIVGIISDPEFENIVVGKAKDSDDFLSYSESKLTIKNPHICGANELKENQSQKISFDPQAKNGADKASNKCVRIFYELSYKTFQSNNYNTTATTNWITAIHNNVATLYYNDGISIAMSSVYVWTTQDPYYSSLDRFRSYRNSFNGDLAHLVDLGSGGVAYLNGLCTNYRYGYSGVYQNYSNVPTYSWTVGVITHEIGHNLGSPHTHDCSWNGNNTAIDSCGAAVGYGGGCNASIPSGGGTIMSYCHMTSVGINFSKGFGTQPGTLIRNRIASKTCLGNACTAPPISCKGLVTNLTISQIEENSANIDITGTNTNSWKYRLTTMNGTVVAANNVNTSNFSISNLQPATYYKLFVAAACSNDFQRSQIFLTDANWCEGVAFVDTGGSNGNYGDNENIVKTFYPSIPGTTMTLTFSQFDLESNYDYIYVYNGPSTASPLFTNGTLTGSTLPPAFTSSHPSGAITVKFISDQYVNNRGWIARLFCGYMNKKYISSSQPNEKSNVQIFPNPAKDIITISTKEKLKSYSIYDQAGRFMVSSSLVGNRAVVNISSFPKGKYTLLIEIETEKQPIIKSIIKK
ncbi:M12 family metallo-peptidase [Chryseobacterium fistulae]|uniref:Por secretion system C-terminal sorting domain-containing protein n=1 Tax=Chryseobacterium fistulae TaxID=2675058 RepID=A0A6N4XR10_9FLAO|nr:M12 family metallo-peptidase [Chryseobacterium fistulae]CAA7386576.1 hypothetical protein CHRY9393_00872 [Chryseobacterium fistulae]